MPELPHVELEDLEDELHHRPAEAHQNDGPHAHDAPQDPAHKQGAALQHHADGPHRPGLELAGEDAHEPIPRAAAQPGGHINIHAQGRGDQAEDAQHQPGEEGNAHGKPTVIGQQSEAGDQVAGAQVHDVPAQENVDKGAEAHLFPAEDVDEQDDEPDGDVGPAKGDEVGPVGEGDADVPLEELCHTVVEDVPGLHPQIGHQSHGRAEAHDREAQDEADKLLDGGVHGGILHRRPGRPEVFEKFTGNFQTSPS